MRGKERRRRAWLVRGVRGLGLVAVLAASSRAVADAPPSLTDSCPASQIEQLCSTQAGQSGTCVPAECRQTVDPQTDPFVDASTTVACNPCAICEATGPFQRCTDTIACAPGFFCFNYGVTLLAASGPPENPIQFAAWASTASCLEGGAGPEVTSSWAPCDGENTGPGEGVTGSSSDAGASSAWEASADMAEGGAASLIPARAATWVDASAPVDGTSAPTNREADLDLSRGGCDVGADAAANGIPLLGVVCLGMLRRRRSRSSE
jgi:hypothetical protein